MRRTHTLALIVLTLVAYLPAWPGGFLVEDWPFMRRHEQWSLGDTVRFELGRPLRDRAWVERERPDFFTAALWRPLPYIAWHAEANLFGQRRGGYFATRLGLHVLTAWLFAAAIVAWTANETYGLLAGLLYALHPTRFYALLVTCQSQMLLAGFGVVCALWGLGIWARGRPRAGATATTLGAVFACFSYEQAVAVLVLLPALFLLISDASPVRTRVKAVLIRAIPIVVVVAVYVGLRILRFEGFGGYTQVESGESTLALSKPIAFLGALATTTWNACVSFVLPISRQDWQLWGPADYGAELLNAVIGLATVGFVIWRYRSNARQAAVVFVLWVLFTAWTLLPLAGSLTEHDPWNRYLYFPGFLWVAILAWTVMPRAGSSRAAIPAGATVAVLIGIAWWACAVWHAAWGQAHGLRAALDSEIPPNTQAYVYLDGFSEWVGGRNVFIRNLDGPIDVGRDAKRLRLWQAHGDFHSAVAIPDRGAWPFEAPPLVLHGDWDRTARTLALTAPEAYRPGAPRAWQRWDLTQRQTARLWSPSRLLTPLNALEHGLAFRVSHPLATLESPPLNLPWTPAVLGLDMAVSNTPHTADWIEVLFYTDAQPTPAASHIIRLRTLADGEFHQYVFTLLDHPVPALEDHIHSLGIRPSHAAGAVVQIRTIWVAAAAAGGVP